MKTKMKQLFGILLTLALVLGLIPGMSLTALADDTTGTQITPDTTAPSAGTYYLSGNVALNSEMKITSGDVVINLNGHTLSLKSGAADWQSVIYVNGGNLTINGGSGGKISGGTGGNDKRGGGFHIEAGNVTVNNVDITGNNGAWGGGVYIRNGNGTFTMNNSHIRGNTSINDGKGWNDAGGVYQDGGVFTINGGSITNNYVTGGKLNGALIAGGNAVFNVSGDVIIYNNKDGDSQENLCADALFSGSAGLSIVGPLGQNAKIGITAKLNQVFTHSSNTDYNDPTKFICDNSDHAVGKNDDGQLFIGSAVTVTYKVENGTWSDDTTANKTEAVPHGWHPANVPTGMKASEGFTGGAWNTEPATATITEATTFMYTFDAKSSAVVTEKPKAKSDLIYTGAAQELVTAGAAEGGEMQYAIGTDATTPPTSGWDTSIPTRTNAGTYYVWYKVIADANHNDSEPVCIKVVIQSAAYAVLKVDNADYTIGSGQNAVITVKRSAGDDRTFSLYTGAAMDGTPIASGNCDTAPGSLILTLKSFYLDSLSVGDHKLTISFQDGSVDTTVKILPAASVPTPTPKPVPKTGDSANPALWLAMMLVALIGFAGLAVTGTMKASRKKK